MRDQPVRAPEPFVAATAALAVVTLGVFRLPESFVAVMERSALLQGAAAGWALRILAAAAVGQAAFAGFAVFTPERVAAALAGEAPLRDAGHARLARSLAWNAAGITALTVVYGIAGFAITGERGGFWVFVLIGIAQLAWYYRLIGIIVAWLQLQPETGTDDSGTGPYCPPLARGLLGASVPPRARA